MIQSDIKAGQGLTAVHAGATAVERPAVAPVKLLGKPGVFPANSALMARKIDRDGPGLYNGEPLGTAGFFLSPAGVQPGPLGPSS